MIIVISGASGAGKTTISRHIQSILLSCGVDTSYQEWELSPEYYFVLRWPLSVLYKLFPMFIKRHQKRLAREFYINGENTEIKYIMWSWVVWLDRLLYASLIKHFKKNSVIIIHRYIHGLMVTLLEYYGWGNKEITNKFISYFPDPDVFIILDSPSKILFERSKDYSSLDATKWWRNRYLQIASQFKYPIVDSSNNDKSDTIMHCMKIIGSSLLKRPEDLLLLILSDPYDLSDKELLENIPFEKLDYKYIISKAYQCRIGMQVLDNLVNYRLPKKWQEYVRNELLNLNVKYEETLKMIRDVHVLFVRNNIEYVLFKTIRPYKSVTYDIDVLVRDYSTALRVLQKEGWKISLSQVILREVHLIKNGITLDVHDEVYGVDKNVLLNKRKSINISKSTVAYVPNDNVELLSVLNDVLKGRLLTIGSVHYIRSLLFNNNVDWENFYILESNKQKIKLYENIFRIVTLKDVLFYGGKSIQNFPIIDHVNYSIQNVGELTINLTSNKNIKNFNDVIILLVKELLRDPKRLFRRTLKKYIYKNLDVFMSE